MKIVTVAMQKGGSGKTTTTVNLAAALAEKGVRVLVVDVDPQSNATSWLGIKDAGKGIFSCLCENGSIKECLRHSETERVDVIPSSPWLVGAERVLVDEVGAETMLRRKLKTLAESYDVALIDTPPTLGMLTIGALVAANEVLVPVEAHVMALNGLTQLLETVETVKDRINENLSIIGILACRMDSRTKHSLEIVGELRRRFHDETFSTVIRENIRLAEAPSFGQPITSYDNKSAGAEDYRSLALEVMERWKGNKRES